MSKSGKEIDEHFRYPNGTLKNKMNILDAKTLHSYEYIISATWGAKLLNSKKKIPTNTIDDLCKIHKFMFGRIYDWAGKTRDQGEYAFDTSKNGHDFLPVNMFSNAVPYINEELKNLNNNKKPSPKEYAQVLVDLNDLHPFREGNGRATKIFMSALAHNHGQELTYDRKQEKMIEGLDNLDAEQVAKTLTITPWKLSQKQATKEKNTQKTNLEF